MKASKYLSVLSLCVLTSCVEEKIDLEKDVPDRAKFIAQQHAETARAASEGPVAKQNFKELSELQKIQRTIEIRIAELNAAGAMNGAICPLCRKRFDIQASKAALVTRKKKSARRQKNKTRRNQASAAARSAQPQAQPVDVPMQPQPPQQPQPAMVQPAPGYLPGGFVPAPQPQVVSPYQPPM
ncbi:MAG: hypothetical protein LBF66_01125 [Holosporales bacterium]|jgi:hypothetical protein|nr:hypothetical protein [Holosporales bacterium]